MPAIRIEIDADLDDAAAVRSRLLREGENAQRLDLIDDARESGFKLVPVFHVPQSRANKELELQRVATAGGASMGNLKSLAVFGAPIITRNTDGTKKLFSKVYAEYIDAHLELARRYSMDQQHYLTHEFHHTRAVA